LGGERDLPLLYLGDLDGGHLVAGLRRYYSLTDR
jgi:hypothetical protein